ncbi:MAG: formyltransferase protein [Herbinix sp.]|jgi:methionyl-tRNA formyltransferase|nr:formyltransferase protein [Herbinix sp.]
MYKEKLKIGYFADGPWAHNAFHKLIKDETIEILFICVRYDHKDPILVELAKNNNINLLYHENINSPEFILMMKEYQADLFVSMSFNQIFKTNIINIPPLKTINCHAGKLPFYRGRNILNWVLINDEKEFGITVHYMDEGIDTGDIILQSTYPINDEDDYNTLLTKSYFSCAEILNDAIKLIQNDNIKVIKQKEIDPIGFYCGMRRSGDEVIHWNQTSREIFNFVRAICMPGPQAVSKINDNIIKINKVHLVEGAHQYKNTVGQVVGKTREGFYVKTLDTMVEVVEYSYDGSIKIGDRLV